ncbi:MAG: zf-HC2 domain-containing protein [Chloroflexi bacterium]|nr:zf-HC2 domain-containing protein [Chloroflexota bacterium]
MSNGKHITDQLSAYLDNRLNAAERARLETHLRGCAQCRRDLAELGYTVNTVRALPVMRRPRSYTLSEAQVAPPRWAFGWLYRAMGVATVAAMLLLGLVLTADLLSFTGSGSMAPAAPAPAAMSAATRTNEAASDTARAPEQPKAAPTRAAAAVAQPTTAPAAPVVPPAAAPTTAAAAPTARPPATASPAPTTGPGLPSTAGAAITATATTTPTATPSATATATPAPTNTPSPTASPSPTATTAATATPAPVTRQAQPAAPAGPDPLRIAEFALVLVVLGALGLTLLLRATRPS